MTRTVSFKDTLRQCLTTFKWEVRNCKSPLLIFGILATVSVTFCLAICFSAVVSETLKEADILGAVRAFQISASYCVFAINIIFTIIYTIRVYSYLHNKRKADMYGALPISRRTFFVAKTISAYLLSIVPTLLFLSLIAMMSVCFGQMLVNEVLWLFVRLLIGSLACISFYGLIAVCCGTTANSIISFIFINFAYVAAAAFLRGTLMSFLMGLPVRLYANSFIMTALNPISAYGAGSTIYWLLFSAACLALAIFLVKKRRAECAQTSFAYWLPAYLVKLLIGFNAGMFLGSIFGSISALTVPYLGFLFGFVLGSSAGYVITHMILYRGTDKLFRTAIPLGAMVLTVAAGMALLNFGGVNYTDRVPDPDEVESAGLVDLSDCYCAGTENVISIGRMARDDFEDHDAILAVTTYHQSVIRVLHDNEYSNPYAQIWLNMFVGGVIPSDYYDSNGYVVAYQLKNGRTVMRCYNQTLFSYLYGTDTDSCRQITESKTYFINYSSVMNVRTEKIAKMTINLKEQKKDPDKGVLFHNGDDFYLESRDGIDEAQLRADIDKVITAFRSDYQQHGTDGKEVLRLKITYQKENNANSLLGEIFGAIASYSDRSGDEGIVFDSYTETLQALREIGVLNDKNDAVTDSPYYFRNQPDHDNNMWWIEE